MKVLFVCTGNTCRSVMAEGYLKSKNIKDLEVCSAGIMAENTYPTENTVKVMKEIGIDVSSHISQNITKELIDNSDKIICMSNTHKSMLQSIAHDKICVLGSGIADPYGGDSDVYRITLNEIIKEIDKLFFAVTVKNANKSNIGDIADIEKECFSEPWSETSILNSMEHGTLFFVANVNLKTVGYCGINIVMDEGYITNIGVLEEYRNKGIGKALLEKLDQTAKMKNLSFITLEVRKSNAIALKLYEKFEFKCEGERKDFYVKPKENALILTKRYK